MIKPVFLSQQQIFIFVLVSFTVMTTSNTLRFYLPSEQYLHINGSNELPTDLKGSAFQCDPNENGR